MNLPVDQAEVLNALYQIEEQQFAASNFDGWATPTQIAARLPAQHPQRNNVGWVRSVLDELWSSRRVLQLPGAGAENPTFTQVRLSGLNRHGAEDGRLALEQNDVRGIDPDNATGHAIVALYEPRAETRYRSRTAELVRLLNFNHQRFQMTRGTGLLRYERRDQRRPKRELLVTDVRAAWHQQILRGELLVTIDGHTASHRLDGMVDRVKLARASDAVLDALVQGGITTLARFQSESVLATLCGLYSAAYRSRYDAHVITAGVGSGKSYAFQIGALIHCAYCLLTGAARGFRVLLIYPRVVLAANQFQELGRLVDRVGQLLGVDFRHPVLDAGSQIKRQMPTPDGSLYDAIRTKYNLENNLILVSNLDTLANRLQHPEAFKGLVGQLDLIVGDEIHLLRGIYGSHARMILERLNLLRALHKLRTVHPQAPFADLIRRRPKLLDAYFVGASATIAEPSRHTARLLRTTERQVLHIEISEMEPVGWVHHLFLRQKPEISTMSALVNATACLIHNRRDGLFREYYQAVVPQGAVRSSLALSALANPVLGSAVTNVEPRDPADIHKTVGFCDSLDGVGRWSDLVADNERTKRGLGVQLNPQGSYPYFVRFQEPLWRLPHQSSFAAQRKNWQDVLRSSYGQMCRECKKGVRCSTARVPSVLNDAGRREVEKLWSATPQAGSYLDRLGVDDNTAQELWMAPFHQARQAVTISNLEGCAFFQTGMCWWWSMDHAGSNAAHPPTAATPLNGVRRLRARADNLSHFVNSLRLQAYTSQSDRSLFDLATINDIFQESIQKIFRDWDFSDNGRENAALIIGSPRLEVGVDLSKVMDGITYRAMRDPASLQQKVGRVGRELGADSVLVHLVTANTRDLYYFRNPQIALDPDYLQALPLHEDNRIVARHHLFMAIVDFLCLQGDEPGDRQLGDDGARLWLINDRALRGFSVWHFKVKACWDYLFGAHPHQAENLQNLRDYLKYLGAKPDEVENVAARAALTPSSAPLSQRAGAIDVFWHEFGPNFLQSVITGRVTLAEICAGSGDTALATHLAVLPRQRTLLENLGDKPDEKAPLRRSYLNNLFTQPIFRRGIPLQGIVGDHPFVWTPNFFESIGTETVAILLPDGDITYESVSTVIGLLAPGTVSYRYGSEPTKVVVTSGHAAGPTLVQAPGFEAVMLAVANPEFFETTACGLPLKGAELPPDFFGVGGALTVYTPRQLKLVSASSNPLVMVDANNYGMLADNDSRPRPMTGTPGHFESMMAPPRCYSRRWYRLQPSAPAPFPLRFEKLLRQFVAPGQTIPAVPLPPVLACFEQITFDEQLAVTDFVWGLDREFMSRNILASRLIYQAPAMHGAPRASVAIGNKYDAPGLTFTMRTDATSEVAALFNRILQSPASVVYQTLLWQVLGRYMEEHGRLPIDPNAPWIGEAPPSVFTVRNVRSAIIFHLLERWHPAATAGQRPASSPQFTVADVASCLALGGPNSIDQATFTRLCGQIAAMRNPPNIAQHATSLGQAWPHLAAAEVAVATAPFNDDYFCKVGADILLNSLGLSLHAAALRQTGAEQEDLAYFYSHANGVAKIYLFDTEAFGNGSIELVRNNLVIPSGERMLHEKLRQLGHVMDPLPSVDFAQCFQERLQECQSSQAAHLAFHAHTGAGAPWTRLAAERDGERYRAGALFDFLRSDMGLSSFDQLSAFRECPEFVAHVSMNYPVYGGRGLTTQLFPGFQALESAISFCLAGCVGCLLSPETNLHGSLRARESVNKVLLDAFFSDRIVGAAARGNAVARVCYPGTGIGCTCDWADNTRVIASALGQAAQATTCTLHLHPSAGGEVVIVPVEFQVTKDGSALTLRPDYSPVMAILPRVRVQMQF